MRILTVTLSLNSKKSSGPIKRTFFKTPIETVLKLKTNTIKSLTALQTAEKFHKPNKYFI